MKNSSRNLACRGIRYIMQAMQTLHKIYFSDARTPSIIPSETVDLVVTSPPYPMIGMWDELFGSFSSEIQKALDTEDEGIFELMHLELDEVWRQMYRVLKPGGILCVNIGDAVRTYADRFRLFPNHSRIIAGCLSSGFSALPLILWRKQTNAPNKFMGSGMLPAGAYVTLEHEYILVFRKGGKRLFLSEEEKNKRRESGYFWEERNQWFSDLWDLKGAGQTLRDKNLRERSAAYPPELALRLITMYSLLGDTVLDPFLGTGTTSRAAAVTGRNSIGLELDNNFAPLLFQDPGLIVQQGALWSEDRVKKHMSFIEEYRQKKGEPRYINGPHGFPVVTRQEMRMRLWKLEGLTIKAEPKVVTAQARYESF